MSILFIFDALSDASILDGVADLPAFEATTNDLLADHNSELSNPIICRALRPTTPSQDAEAFKELAEDFGSLSFPPPFSPILPLFISNSLYLSFLFLFL